jgi:hypothetical protein
MFVSVGVISLHCQAVFPCGKANSIAVNNLHGRDIPASFFKVWQGLTRFTETVRAWRVKDGILIDISSAHDKITYIRQAIPTQTFRQ